MHKKICVKILISSVKLNTFLDTQLINYKVRKDIK